MSSLKIKIDSMSSKLSRFKDENVEVDELLAFGTENDCSDLYVKVGERPYFNRYGSLYEVPCMYTSQDIWERFSKQAISSERNAYYVRERQLDFAYELRPAAGSKYHQKVMVLRYRVSAGFSFKKNEGAFRMIRPYLPSFKTINFPPDIQEHIKRSFESKSGIIMLSGATGSGKSTTISAAINDFSKPGQPLDNSMIITLEDPIEYVYENTKSVRFMQKELGEDFMSFDLGIKQALREHPNVIIPGEIRDFEGISACINAAETGHLVMTTFHASDVAGVISRLYSYIGRIKDDAIYDLIANLDMVIVQRIVSNDSSFKLETQFLKFTYDVKRILQESVEKGRNVSVVINELMKDESLVESGIIKDWS